MSTKCRVKIAFFQPLESSISTSCVKVTPESAPDSHNIPFFVFKGTCAQMARRE